MIKYRKSDYLLTAPSNASEFATESPVYTWSRGEQKLVQTGVNDDYAEIQSHKDCALEAIFDKYNYDGLVQAANAAHNIDSESNDIPDVDLAQDDLDALDDMYDIVEDFRARYGIAETVPVKDVLRYVETTAKETIARGHANNDPGLVRESSVPGTGSGVSDSDSDKDKSKEVN